MKITFFVGEFNGGGAERVISILANFLVTKNYKVEILKYNNTENSYETDSRIRINSIEENTRTRNILKNVLWLHKYFENSTDIVVSFLAPFNMVAIIANTFNKTPIIVCDRNDPRYTPANKMLRYFRNILYRKADGIVLQTKNNKEYFDKQIQGKSIVIYNPVDLKEKSGMALKTKKEKLIVSVGRLEEQKNQIMLIDAFNEIYKKHRDYKLIIYGEGSNRKCLQDRIDSLHLNEVIILPGEKFNVLDKIKCAEMFVLTSDYEGMSNALIEAMCIGLPVISTNTSGSNELIDDGVNGYIIDLNDKNNLINRIEYLINNENIRSNLGKEASNLAFKIDKEIICNEWLEYITSFVK